MKKEKYFSSLSDAVSLGDVGDDLYLQAQTLFPNDQAQQGMWIRQQRKTMAPRIPTSQRVETDPNIIAKERLLREGIAQQLDDEIRENNTVAAFQQNNVMRSAYSSQAPTQAPIQQLPVQPGRPIQQPPVFHPLPPPQSGITGSLRGMSGADFGRGGGGHGGGGGGHGGGGGGGGGGGHISGRGIRGGRGGFVNYIDDDYYPYDYDPEVIYVPVPVTVQAPVQTSEAAKTVSALKGFGETYGPAAPSSAPIARPLEHEAYWTGESAATDVARALMNDGDISRIGSNINIWDKKTEDTYNRFISGLKFNNLKSLDPSTYLSDLATEMLTPGNPNFVKNFTAENTNYYSPKAQAARATAQIPMLQTAKGSFQNPNQFEVSSLNSSIKTTQMSPTVRPMPFQPPVRSTISGLGCWSNIGMGAPYTMMLMPKFMAFGDTTCDPAMDTDCYGPASAADPLSTSASTCDPSVDQNCYGPASASSPLATVPTPAPAPAAQPNSTIFGNFITPTNAIYASSVLLFLMYFSKEKK